MKEIWHDIAGYEGLYQVSNLGRVKSLPKIKGYYFRKKEIFLKFKTNKGGYLTIGLLKNNKAKWFMVHRLVAEAFLPNFENKKQVNHIDGIKENNVVGNLEWSTPSENLLHAFKLGLRNSKGENHNNRKLNLKDVGFILRSNLRNIDLARKFNVCPATICLIRKGIIWSNP